MHPIRHLLALLLMFPLCALCESGYAFGIDHCYHFDAPKGWYLDNRAAADSGVPMVFIPQGSTWQTAEVAMYTRPASVSDKSQPTTNSIREQVNNVIKMYRSALENITAKRLKAVKSKSGAQGELWEFSGYSNGGKELVAYFPNRETVNYFVAQVPKGANVEESKRALVELASSYREGNNCKPCSAGSACPALSKGSANNAE